MEKPGSNSVGPPVVQVLTTINLKYALISHSDSSFLVYSFDLRKALGYSFGHYGKIGKIEWLTGGAVQNAKFLGEGFNETTNKVFLTCSEDMSIYVWRQFGDRWTFSYIDVAKCFDSSLTYTRNAAIDYGQITVQRIGLDKDHNLGLRQSMANNLGLNKVKTPFQVKLTAMTVHPKLPYVVCGDNRGTLRVFDLATGNIINSTDLSYTANSIDMAEIVDLAYSPNGHFIAIAYASGMVNLHDTKH